jgi:Endomembrane protein 70
MIDAYKERTVGVYNIPGAFLHAKQTDLTYLKMTDEAVHFIVEISPSNYKDCVITEKGKGVLYLVLKKALYGCVKSALLFWEDLSGKVIKRGYDLNPYNRCIANKIVDNSLRTVVWHVDDLKLSHANEKVLDSEVRWLESLYGPLIGAKNSCHTYLGIDMCFKDKKLQLSMVGYLHEIVEEFSYEIAGKVAAPVAPHLFDKDESGTPLSIDHSKIFHQVVAKVLKSYSRFRLKSFFNKKQDNKQQYLLHYDIQVLHAFLSFFLLDLMTWTQRSTDAIPFTTIIVLLVLWLVIFFSTCFLERIFKIPLSFLLKTPPFPTRLLSCHESIRSFDKTSLLGI